MDGTLSAPDSLGDITFDNVWFRYAADDQWVLKGVSITIPFEKTTAIVGASGAGKSTLMSLLFRFYDPECGSITADGTSIDKFMITDYRSRFALMAQEVQLFNDTIRENIGYGRLSASPSEIENAARVALADDFIKAFPDGYNTVVGDGGLRLSGGQRQRIALARTILRNPQVLMLDEATNALDIETEQAFQLALERFVHRRTVVVIAHRLSTVQNADHIVVMAKGRVVEAGPPQQLIQDAGHFSRLLDLQHGLSGVRQE